MSEKSQGHQEQEASPQVNPLQQAHEQGPVSEQSSPTAAAQRAINTPPVARKPSDYIALQKTVGNQAVQRIVESSDSTVQREFRDDPGYQSWRSGVLGEMRGLQSSLQNVDEKHSQETDAINSSSDQWGSMADAWNQGAAGGGGGGGGGGGSGSATQTDHQGSTETQER